MHRRIRTVALGAMTMGFAFAADAQQPAPAAKPAAKPTGGVAVTEVTKWSAVILNINYATRNVTLQTPQGVFKNYTFSKNVKDVMSIKPGDTVHVEVVQSLAMYMRHPTDPAPPPAGTVQLVAKGKQVMDSALVQELDATVTYIDYPSRVISLAIPNGDTLSFKADTSVHNFKSVKKGDEMIVRITQAYVVGITK